DRDDFPAILHQTSHSGGISSAVCEKLFLPELGSGLRHSEVGAVRMGMPEAAVDEDCRAPLRQHDVRLACEAPDMKAEAESPRPKTRPDDSLRSSIPAANARHHPRPHLRFNNVSHAASL